MSDKIQKMVQEKVLSMLEEGTIPWKKTWSGGEGGKAKNIITNKVYQGTNFFLLNFQGYTSPYWLSFKQAKDLGGNVKKGEKSSFVVFWTTLIKEDAKTEKEVKFPFMRYTAVFNLDQTEGVKVPERSEEVIKKYNNSPIENCEQILSEFTNFPGIVWGMKPCYNHTMDQIGMPKIDRFESAEEYYAVFFHEMGHSTRHLTRLDRTKTSYAKEELVAEMTACFLCAEAGIETSTIKNQVAYIQGWRKEISNDVKLVTQAASQAIKAANYIMGINEFTEMKENAA
jgi:antirestriction protein ArdC